ncbi:MAG TPA: protein kinase [Polyangiaceae bacterium]|nr:protein kinase [Polyangiaceae bacterium]
MSGRVVLGRYRVVAPLARGGMGIVYLGRLEGAAGFSKPVVIKTVIPDAKDARAAQLFAREARIVSNLQHPSIVGVLDFGEVDGEYIMVLEYVHGFHLGNWWRFVQEARGCMPVAHAVEVMLPVLDALDFAHRLKRADGTPLDIVHRDISPANILIDLQGNVKLHDFGIARMADDEFKTQDGTFRGTLSFTAPETLQGVAASPRSDLYACGVVLYQLLAGSNPFRGELPSETLHRVMTHVPPRLRTLRDEVGSALDDAIARALEKEPAKRFESAGAFAAALRAARTWSEAAATAEMAAVIEADFSGREMSAFLGVDSLQSRDAAWRAAQPSAASLPLGSSRPPGGTPRDQVTETGEGVGAAPGSSATLQGVPSAELLALARPGSSDTSKEGEATFIATVPPLSGSLLPAGMRESAPSRKRVPLIAFVAGGLLLALAGVSYAWLAQRAAPPKERFLLIEKQADPEPSPAAQASASGSVAAPVTAPSAEPSRSAMPAAKAPRPTADVAGSSLTAAFQRQRGRIEACFRAQPTVAAEQPQLTIRFQVEASGAVRSADLVPASLAGSALGSCILGVARATRFPAGEAPVSFTIPITARKTAG